MSNPRTNKSVSASGMTPISSHRVLSQKGDATVSVYTTNVKAYKHLLSKRPPRPPRMMPGPIRPEE